MMDQSLQDYFAAKSICFGCGPANSKGLQVKSFVVNDEVIAHWQPKPEYQAFPGVLNGGIVGALLDCNCNWAASWHLMQINRLTEPPCTVTANYHIKLLRPTPTDQSLEIRAKILSSEKDRAQVYGELSVKGKVCATCEGLFVAVKPEHPAFHRW